MGTLWSQNEASDWVAAEVGEDARIACRGGELRIVAFGGGSERRAALLVRPGIAAWVSGQPVVAGLRILAHRDEILVDSHTWYYSTEAQPVVTTFQPIEGQRPPRCAVCRVAIEPAERVVACPQCGRWFHQSAARGELSGKQCFTYRPTCVCGHPTSLGGEPIWRPEKET